MEKFVWLKARTGEEFWFEVAGPKPRPAGPTAVLGYESGSEPLEKVDIRFKLPDDRKSFRSITIKLWNNGFGTEEYREFRFYSSIERIQMINPYAYYSYFTSAVGSNPRAGLLRNIVKSTQSAEFILEHSNGHKETLICPVNGTPRFNMCFFDALK